MNTKDWFFLGLLVFLIGVFTFFFVRMGIDPPEPEDDKDETASS